ncbi:NPCBM/NEW2 domain protein [Caulifigura coniformis]|uniref:NPCBM/NEW2 domain protein n=1 Tax=Caulifigura coniformis TaxID=2527983 RepID=A0A517SEZ1_9PLAN|nr:NPCBM/NEW2 domain-containing protein [Caulifigura coniformis]QDT54705.1 NPCBM/NEW2 domain protein [Caulifigura coniformis]
MNRSIGAGLGTLVVAALACCDARADTIQTAAGETITGKESMIVDGTLVLPASDGKPEVRFPLADLDRVTFSPSRPTGDLKARFVRIDQPGAGKPLSLAEVELFEGDKKIAQGAKARQSVSYMDDDEKWGAQKAIDGKTGGDSTTDGVTRTLPTGDPWWEVELPSDAGIGKMVVWLRTDAQPNTKMAGFRVQLLNAQRQLLWTKSFNNPAGPKVEIEPPVHSDKLSADDIKAIETLGTVKGTLPLAALVSAWIRDEKVTVPAETSGQQSTSTVVRAARGGFSAEAPQQQTAAVKSAPLIADGEWLIRFEPDGFLVGKITSWNEQGLSVEFQLERHPRSIVIPTAAVIEVSSKDVIMKTLSLDRSQISTEGDTVFAKAEGNALQAVVGTVKGIEGESLQFEFQGKVRGIKLARVASIMRKRAANPTASTQALVQLSNAMRLCGRPKSLSGSTAVLELPWQQPFKLGRSSMKSFSVWNGRAVALTDLEPSGVEYTPFLDRVLPYSTNESLTGSPLAIGNATYERGLCVHSGTRLTYDLGGAFEKLRLQVGLQKEDGLRGQAVVRIKGDDSVLAEKPVAGSAPAETVDVSLAGKRMLVIEIDYGDGLDVGDHVVIGQPVLVRTSTP